MVRHTPSCRHLVAKCDTISGHFDIWSDVWVRLTFGQTYPLGQRHLVAKCDTTSSQVDIWSDVWVSLKFGQTYPQTETSCYAMLCYVYFYIVLVPMLMHGFLAFY